MWPDPAHQLGDGPRGQELRAHDAAPERDKTEIGVVADQVGYPTSTHTRAAACWSDGDGGYTDRATGGAALE